MYTVDGDTIIRAVARVYQNFIRAVARGKRPPSLGKDVFYRSKVMLNDGFINAIGKIISKFQRYNRSEQLRISKSISNWTRNYSRDSFIDEDSLKARQIIFVDFGLCITPEMAYYHPALILKVENHRCVVLPCTSNESKFDEAYHPIYNQEGNKSFYRLYANNGGLLKNTAIDITQIRTISFGRIKTIFDIQGIELEDFKNVVSLAHSRFFNYEHRKIEYQFNDINNLRKENSLLQMTIEASKILDVYNVTTIADLKDLIGISTDVYTFLIGTPIQKNSAQYEVEVKLIDKYNQEISKIIRYNLIAEQL